MMTVEKIQISALCQEDHKNSRTLQLCLCQESIYFYLKSHNSELCVIIFNIWKCHDK